MDTNYTIIFTGGEAPEREIVELVTDSIFINPFVIAADSGLAVAEKYNLSVDVLLGDMDSLSEIRKKNAQALVTKVYPAHKDYTDTELALLEASRIKNSPIILIGGNGGRFDHLMAIRSLYERQSVIPYPEIWFCGANMILCMDEESRKTITIQGLTADDYVSMFPIYIKNSEPKLLSKGLLWDVTNLDWHITGGSVSNKAIVNAGTVENVEFELESGRFLVCIPLHANSGIKVF